MFALSPTVVDAVFSANSGRGAPIFVRETIGRTRRAGPVGPLTLRADSGFYSAGSCDLS